MQLQMEVWNIEECDFLETVFKQYNSEEEFYNDRGKSGYVFTRNEIIKENDSMKINLTVRSDNFDVVVFDKE